MNERQRRLALGQVIPQVLAPLGGVGAVVKHVIDQLVGRAEVAAVGGERLAQRPRSAGEHRGHFGPGLEQLGRLAVDHLEITLLAGVRIVRVHQLHHLALGDHVGGLGHDLHHRLGGERGHHLESARVHEIPDQHARLITEDLIGRVAPAAQRGAVDHVIVQQRGRVDEFDERRRLDVRGPVAAGAPREHHQQRPQPLAAARDDVLCDLVYERYCALEALADGIVNGGQIGLDQGSYFFKGH